MSLKSLYNSYLIEIAIRENRPFNLPRTSESLEKRPDYNLFIGLRTLLSKDGITTIREFRKWMSLASLYTESDTFHILLLVNEFEEIQTFIKNYKEPTEQELVKKIRKSFSFLEVYFIEKGINKGDELVKGVPPLILKLWKQGHVDELTLVRILDFDTVRKQSWFKIYASEFSIKKVKDLKAKIIKSIAMTLEIKNGVLKLLKVTNN